MNINEFIQKYRKVEVLVPDLPSLTKTTSSRTPHVMCNDGFTMSVQAGQSLYSIPNDVADSYESVEVGFPSEDEPLLLNHDGYEDQTDYGVFPYVPCSVVDEIIEKHGGIDVEFHNEVTTEAS